MARPSICQSWLWRGRRRRAETRDGRTVAVHSIHHRDAMAFAFSTRPRENDRFLYAYTSRRIPPPSLRCSSAGRLLFGRMKNAYRKQTNRPYLSVRAYGPRGRVSDAREKSRAYGRESNDNARSDRFLRPSRELYNSITRGAVSSHTRHITVSRSQMGFAVREYHSHWFVRVSITSLLSISPSQSTKVCWFWLWWDTYRTHLTDETQDSGTTTRLYFPLCRM